MNSLSIRFLLSALIDSPVFACMQYKILLSPVISVSIKEYSDVRCDCANRLEMDRMSKFACPRMQICMQIPVCDALRMRIYIRMPVQEDPQIRKHKRIPVSRYPRMRIFVTEYRLLHYNDYTEY